MEVEYPCPRFRPRPMLPNPNPNPDTCPTPTLDQVPFKTLTPNPFPNLGLHLHFWLLSRPYLWPLHSDLTPNPTLTLHPNPKYNQRS